MLNDVRYAIRTLLKSPGFTLIAITSPTLGIGAVSAMFSFADAMVLRPMPVPNPRRLITVQSQLRGESVGGVLQYFGLSYPDFVDLRDRSKSFEGLTASEYSQFEFATDKSALPQMKFGLLVSGNFFRVLAVRQEWGRDFRPDEDQVNGRDAVVILGYDLWRSEFASNSGAIGRPSCSTASRSL